MKLGLAALLAFALGAQSQSVPPTNLPSSVYERANDAVFAANASKLISGTTIDEVWQVLLDFDVYAEWNPFVRSVCSFSTVLEDRVVVERRA